MLGVDKSCHAAQFLGFRDDLQSDGGLARRLGPEDLNHTAARNSTYAQGSVKGNGAGRYNGYGTNRLFAAEAHDGTLAELLLNLR